MNALNNSDRTSALEIVEQVCCQFDGHGIFSVGAIGALRAMAHHWKDHLFEGHDPKIISEDIDEMKKQLVVMQQEVMKLIGDVQVAQSKIELKDTLQTFMNLLKRANAVTVDNGPLLINWSASSIEGVRENRLALFSWVDEDYIFNTALDEGGIADGHFSDDGVFVCEDEDGETTEIRMFALTQIHPLN